MNVRHVFVTNDFAPKLGGIESYLRVLCKGLDPKRIVVVAPARKGYERVDAQLPHEVVRLPGTYLRASRAVGRQIGEIASRRDVGAVHFLHALPLGRLGQRVRAGTGKPYTVFAHGSEILIPARIPVVAWSLRRTLAGADMVFAVSEFTRAAVDRYTKGRARTAVLHPAVEVNRFSLGVSGAGVRERYRLGSRFVVLFVSRLVRKKGAETLVRAMAGLPKAVALVVGTGPEEAALKRLVEELELTGRVVFAGRVPDRHLPQFYAAADVFCMPCSSRLGGVDTEGFGIVYMEAAASGLPCVAGDCGGSVEAVEDGVTGVVLADPTPTSVARALKQFAQDPVLRTTYGAAGRARAETWFSPQAQAERFEENVSEMLGARTAT